MYLLITVVVALLAGLVLVSLVQFTFGAPEAPQHPGSPGDRPRFGIARRGYDMAEVDNYLASLHLNSTESGDGSAEGSAGAADAPPAETREQTR